MQSIAVNLGRQDDLTENLIGAEVYLSLKPFMRFIEEKSRTDKSTKQNIYRYILSQFDKYPELGFPISPADAGKYAELFELIYICLSPLLNEQEQQLWALGVPLTPHFYFGTPAFYAIILDPITQELKVGLNLTGPNEMEQSLRASFYNLVLKKFYNTSLTDKQFTIYSIVDQGTHLLKYYRLHIDTRFIEVYNHGSLPQLSLQHLKVNAKDDATILAMLGRVLPTTQFSVEGIAVVNLKEVTVEYALESIKDVIIEHTECSVGSYHAHIVQALKTICGTDTFEFGLLPYLRLNGKTLVDDQSGFQSILLHLTKLAMPGDYQQLLAHYLAAPRKLIFQEISTKEQEHFPMLKLLFQNGVTSYALFPLYYSGKLVGCLEVYSRNSNTFDTHTLSKLEPSFSLLAQLFQNIITDFNYELTRVITDKFTSIQPAVQWQFYDAAYEALKSEMTGAPLQLKAISFQDVQPFYGAIDIKDSSVRRNLAIRKDLNLHFELLENTLQSIASKLETGIQDYIPSDALISNYKAHAQLSDTEILKIEDYLLRQLPPYFRLLQEGKPELSEIIENYFVVTGLHGIVYANRTQYEKSMQTINGKINSMLKDFNATLQNIYPCYFEKFRTDGVEFDIYVGQSIAPELPIPNNLIQTFRLLHLEAIANIAQAAHALIPEISDYLQTTQLIFVHEKAIDISFRPDEQRFDVEGGYNIRYQLVKKRIDKAHIKNSEERLTQPGKIAIVYMNSMEAQEYVGYIKVLQSRNILKDDVEHIEIEELQGVDGLKALRVGIVF
ncbi:MAG: hypothetical protein JWQ28_1924 [Pedobacter sp.]|jgi:hypothetical protein|nr:hypothetical protein [Pedobacter sp.]